MSTIYQLASAARTANGDSGPLSNDPNRTASPFLAMNVDIAVTAVAGTTPTLDVYLEGLDANGNWYQIWHPAQITAVPTGPIEQSVGPGLQTAIAVPAIFRVRWVIGGTTPSFTFAIAIEGLEISR